MKHALNYNRKYVAQIIFAWTLRDNLCEYIAERQTSQMYCGAKSANILRSKIRKILRHKVRKALRKWNSASLRGAIRRGNITHHRGREVKWSKAKENWLFRYDLLRNANKQVSRRECTKCSEYWGTIDKRCTISQGIPVSSNLIDEPRWTSSRIGERWTFSLVEVATRMQ